MVRTGVRISLLILAVLFFAGLIYFTRYDLRLGPIIKSGSGDSGSVGSCAFCLWDQALPGSEAQCDSWLNLFSNGLVSKIKKSYNSDQGSDTCYKNLDLSCLPSSCKGKPIKVQVYGHSGKNTCKPFIDFVYRVCTDAQPSCTDVVHSGCFIFNDIISALQYASDLQSKSSCAQVTITANQFFSYFNSDGKCAIEIPSTNSFVTLNLSAKCSSCTPASCNFGEYCGQRAQYCSDPYCKDTDGSLVQKICCDSGPNQGKWVRKEECSSCDQNGACCFAQSLPACYSFSKKSCYEFGYYEDSTFYEGKDCKSFTCPNPNNLGACCHASNLDWASISPSCQINTKEQCAFESGQIATVFAPNVTCSLELCNQLIKGQAGSCCIMYNNSSKNYCRSGSSQSWCLGLSENLEVIDVTWTADKVCSQVICGVPRVGKCCLTYDDGVVECKEGLTSLQCQRLKDTPIVDKNIVDTHWDYNKTCSDGSCQPAKGACCKTNICTGGLTCLDDLNYKQCMSEATSCVIPQWSAQKKCNEIHCDLLGCKEQRSDAYIGDSCNDCQRNMGCSVYDILNGGCPHWCSSEKDFRGNVCCGPI